VWPESNSNWENRTTFVIAAKGTTIASLLDCKLTLRAYVQIGLMEEEHLCLRGKPARPAVALSRCLRGR
jgi:hypothetical protein